MITGSRPTMSSPDLFRRTQADGLLHVRLRHARLRTRSEQPRLSNDIVFVAVESVSVAVRTCRNMTRNDRIAALANFEFPGRLNDFLCSRCALGEMAIGHDHAIADCPRWLNGV